MNGWGRSLVFAFVAFALSPGMALAQSAIAGVVKDTSGAVLPGVTVTASSPALIEGMRNVTTDGAGQYKIINLRPGTYTVTFTLPGFNTVKRGNVDLPANFTAPVNAEMRVGAVEETVTVSAQTPIVDVQSAAQQQVLPKALLDAVPTGGRNIQSVGTLMAGVQKSGPDVGGAAGMQQRYLVAHGADPKDDSIMVDGMSVKGIEGDGAIQNYFNEGMFQEFSYQTGAISAESSSGGVLLNMIPKEGGNRFTGDLFYSGTGSGLQSNNVTQALIDQGLKAGDSVDAIHDLNVSGGGPIKRDKIWFYTSFRHWGVNQKVANAFYNLDPTHLTYQPGTQQVVDNNHIRSHELRVTWQATQQHKFSAYLDRIFKYRFHEGAADYTEEAFSIRDPSHGIYYTAQAKYTGTLTSKVLVEFGWSSNNETYTTAQLEPSAAGTLAIPKEDIITGAYWGAAPGPYHLHVPVQRNWDGALSYVTGSHAVKVGMQWGYGFNRNTYEFQQRDPNGSGNGIDLIQRYRNGVPDSVVVYNTPVDSKQNLNADLGIYAQDNWTLKRATITGGVRFEHFNTSIAQSTSPAGRFVPQRSFPAVTNYPNWNDVVPRIGLAWDLLGDGTTAFKTSWGRYMTSFSTVGFAQLYDPLFQATDVRTWTDLNGDGVAQDNEIGPSQNANFGIAPERSPDPNIKRPYDNEFTASIQRQLVPGVAVTFGYYHRDYHRLFYSDNTALSPSDWTPITITNPLTKDPLTVYSLAKDKVGAINIVDKNSPTNTRVYNGFELSFNARLGGANVFGGMTADRTVSNYCQPYVGQRIYDAVAPITAASNPNWTIYCDENKLNIPFRTQFKLSGDIPLPGGVEFSGTFQSYPGTINYGSGSGSRAAAVWLPVQYKISPKNVPGLNQSAETVSLIPSGTKWLDRLNQTDIRFAKKFPLGYGGGTWQLQVDLFNVFNASTPVGTVETYGSRLDAPTQILLGRLLSIGAQLHF
jgi:Carboxypeptidase regulatory-like domain